MPAAADDRYRVVVDEDGLDWRSRTETDLVDAVDNLADLLELLTPNRQVALMRHAYEVECWESVQLSELYFTRDGRVPRDARLRLAVLLDKCQLVEPCEDDLPQPVHVGGGHGQRSFGFCHALALAARGRAMSCLLASPGDEIVGWAKARRETDTTDLDIHLLTVPAQLPEFWRGVLRQERIPEPVFFELAERAFPELLFAESLTFGHFTVPTMRSCHG